MKYLLCVLGFLISPKLYCQVYKIDNSIPVVENGVQLKNAWAGGLNSGQYSTMDVDFDGVEDLVVFDRSASKINVFISSESGYRHKPEASLIFPEGLSNWVLLRDYNCDGLKDIFTSDPLGIRLYVNTSSDGQLSWRIFNDRGNQAAILTKGFSDNPINLQMNSSDIPAIEDIDSDGDLDILVYRFSSSATIELHRNFSMENTASCDSLQFRRATQNYGNIEECGCGTFAFNGSDCPPSGGRTEHQSGKSLLAIDMNGDNVLDLVSGEESCTILSVLINEGTALDPIFNSASSQFPNSQSPVNMGLFPAAFAEDIDNDGDNDILVAPNVPGNVGYSVDFKNSSWLYLNSGTDANPSYQLSQFDFLQDDMIDLGENAAPAFYDFDNDGDQDMFISSFVAEARNFRSTLALYENKGTPLDPSFELMESDWKGIGNLGFINLKPEFIDIDMDGLTDLTFTATSSTGQGTNAYYFKRLSGNMQFDFNPRQVFGPINSGENVKFYDVNRDKLMDVLYGRSTGRVQYYQNTGSKDMPSFALADDSFYGLDFSPIRQNPSIDIGDLDNDGNADMIIGDARGTITIYSNFRDNLEEPLEGVTEFIQINDNIGTIPLGSKLRPDIVNIFNEDKPSIALGTGQGGVVILRNSGGTPQPYGTAVGLYPNPISKSRLLKVSSAETAMASIISISGQLVMENLFLQSGVEVQLDVSRLKEGLYILRVESSGETTRFIVTR